MVSKGGSMMSCKSYCKYLDDDHCSFHNHHDDFGPRRELSTIETSFAGLQNIPSNNQISLGSVVPGTRKGRAIDLSGSSILFNLPGLYLVSYSTSAVWTTLPYGTNEARVQLQLDGTFLEGSETRVQVLTPSPVEDQKLNLAKTVLVPVPSHYSLLRLINLSSQIMGFINTTVTVVKVA